MEHPVVRKITAEGFTPLGWFEPTAADGVPGFVGNKPACVVILIGNAGTEMFDRFSAECDPAVDLLDDWCRKCLVALAQDLGATAVFPFDKPPLPFLRWAQKAGCGHGSKLGMNIHPKYGLWHAFRAAFVFAHFLDLPLQPETKSPCETCTGQPCLSACPVSAFDANGSASPYDVDRCVDHLRQPAGDACLTDGCMARLACPVGAQYIYGKTQMEFHLSAFLRARTTKAGTDA